MSEISSQQKNRIFWISFPTLCLISLALIVLTIIPQSREIIRSLIISQSRIVLAKVDGLVLANGPQLVVIKVKTADTLAIEIFAQESSSLKFIKRLVLDENRDAFFNFRGRITNLAFADIDADGSLEIVAPTFDEDLVPHLNLYKFDKERGDFFKLGPSNFKL